MKVHVSISLPVLVDQPAEDKLPLSANKSIQRAIANTLKRARPSKVGRLQTLAVEDKNRKMETHLLLEEGEVRFLCAYTVQNEPVRCARQELIWKEIRWKPNFGLAWMQQLLSKESAVITSAGHKPKGKQLWLRFVEDCLRQGNFAYYVVSGKIVQEFYDIEQVKELESTIWTLGEEGRNNHILVSKTSVRWGNYDNAWRR